MAGILRIVFNEVLVLGDSESNPANGLTDLMPATDSKTKSNFGYITSTDDFTVLLQKIHKPDPNRDTAITLALRFIPLGLLRPKKSV